MLWLMIICTKYRVFLSQLVHVVHSLDMAACRIINLCHACAVAVAEIDSGMALW